MFLNRRSFLIIPRQVGKIARCSTQIPEEIKITKEKPITPGFLSRISGLHYQKCSEILAKHNELYSLKQKDIINTVEALKSFNYDLKDVHSRGMILYVNSATLLNRHQVLKESGVSNITLSVLFKYLTVTNKNVSMLKALGVIPFDTNVTETLCRSFTDIEVSPKESYSENIPLKIVRKNILNLYLMEKLEMDSTAIEKLWKVYARVRHKSYQSVQRMIEILTKDLNFPKDRIVKNGYLLHGDPDNLLSMMEKIKTIGNYEFKEILYRRPKIAMSSTDSILKTIEHVKSFNISETAISRCIEVLTLGPDTVLDRLRDLNEIEEFKVLITNPRILRLVHHQNKARLRLDYLNQLKVKCASLHILSCGSDMFARFARDGSDRTKGRDIVVFLANIFQKDESIVRSLMSRHPNWCHIPVLSVKHCYDFLIAKGFLDNDIYSNLHILLYPIGRIEEKYSQLKNNNEIFKETNLATENVSSISNRELLTLILYLIEGEFHFTGDGIWTEHHTQPVENFNNLLPDFTESYEKVYKFGVKPAESAQNARAPTAAEI